MPDPYREKHWLQDGGVDMRVEKDKKADKKRSAFRGYTGGKLRAFLILAFAAVYVLSMLLATWVDQLGRQKDYWGKIVKIEQEIWDNMRYKAQAERISADDTAEGAGDDWQIHKLYEEVTVAALVNSTEYQRISAAVYDADGNLAAKSTNLLTAEVEDETGTATVSWPLSDYLSDEEIETLAGYEGENYEPHEYAGVTYEIKAAKTAVGNRLGAISVRRLFYSTEDVKEAGNIGPAWQWENMDQKETDPADRAQDSVRENDSISDAALNRLQNVACYFPGMEQNRGIDGWHEWMAEEYLQNYPETYSEPRFLYSSGGLVRQTETSAQLFLGEDYNVPDYTLVIRSVEYPWKEAFDSLKNIYLWGGALTLLSAGLVLWIVEKTFRRRAILEERQRDFTNAIAHEMKTPLAVIRGFAENLEENTNEEKRKYYLEQIIGQTEQMDDMVKEMVFISRLDSGEYRPVKEPVSVRELIGELHSTYDTQIEEKQIEVRISCGEDLVISGDKRFLEKAFGNLIANAVDHNRYEGKINIDIEKDRCVIENTGEKISPEDLPRVCELFYTGDKSRGGQEKHLGVGLYLADRIFRAYRMKLKIANTEDGVRVTVEI